MNVEHEKDFRLTCQGEKEAQNAKCEMRKAGTLPAIISIIALAWEREATEKSNHEFDSKPDHRSRMPGRARSLAGLRRTVPHTAQTAQRDALRRTVSDSARDAFADSE